MTCICVFLHSDIHSFIHSFSPSLFRLSMSKLSYIGFSWCVVLSHVSSSLVEAVANFLSCLYLANNVKLINKAIKLLTGKWRNSETLLLQALDGILGATPTSVLLPFLNIVCKICRECEGVKDTLNEKKVMN